MKTKLFVLLAIVNVIGCFDSLKTIEETIVGNISVMDSNDEEGGRYHLEFYNEAEHFNMGVIADFVVDIIGNDSVLLIKGVDRDSCFRVYYKVTHERGKKIIGTSKLDLQSYLQQKGTLGNPKYKFSTDKIKCP